MDAIVNNSEEKRGEAVLQRMSRNMPAQEINTLLLLSCSEHLCQLPCANGVVVLLFQLSASEV